MVCFLDQFPSEIIELARSKSHSIVDTAKREKNTQTRNRASKSRKSINCVLSFGFFIISILIECLSSPFIGYFRMLIIDYDDEFSKNGTDYVPYSIHKQRLTASTQCTIHIKPQTLREINYSFDSI